MIAAGLATAFVGVGMAVAGAVTGEPLLLYFGGLVQGAGLAVWCIALDRTLA